MSSGFYHDMVKACAAQRSLSIKYFIRFDAKQLMKRFPSAKIVLGL